MRSTYYLCISVHVSAETCNQHKILTKVYLSFSFTLNPRCANRRLPIQPEEKEDLPWIFSSPRCLTYPSLSCCWSLSYQSEPHEQASTPSVKEKDYAITDHLYFYFLFILTSLLHSITGKIGLEDPSHAPPPLEVQVVYLKDTTPRLYPLSEFMTFLLEVTPKIWQHLLPPSFPKSCICPCLQ